MFSFRCGIQESDTQLAACQKLVAGIAEFVPENSEMYAHRIGQLIGFDFTNSPHLADVLEDARQVRDLLSMLLSRS
jgi:hypothetical protein